MGEDCGSWFPQQQFNCQSPNLNSSSAPFYLGQQNTMNPGANMVSTNGTLPVYANTELPHSQVVQADEPCGWFYCLPRFRQAFTAASSSVLKEHLLASPCENHKEIFKPNAGSGCGQKRFLVFDQSGNQTTLIFSTGIGPPVQCQTSWGPKPPGACNLNRESPGTKGDLNLQSGAISTDEFDENNGTHVQSEMHEDTEELNALLYSDDESDYTEDDDEVTSTGHSPSTMTAHNQQDWFDGTAEEVASSVGATKKRKQFDGGYDDVPSLIDTATTLKLNRRMEYEDDAESSCAYGSKPGSGEMDSLSGNKRMRKEKIRETVSVLQSLLPVGKGEDVIVVLDEAISYLKSMKHKAEALGLDAL